VVMVELSFLPTSLSSVQMTLRDTYSVRCSVEAKFVIIVNGEDCYDLCHDMGRDNFTVTNS